MSYKEVQRIYKEQFGKTAKSSWIAQIKSENGKTSGPSPNRDAITSIHALILREKGSQNYSKN